MTSSFISAALTERDWRDSRHIARGWFYWPLKIVGDSHAYAFVYLAVVGGSVALHFPRYRTPAVLLGAIGSLALSAFLFLITHWLRIRSVKSKVTRHNAQVRTWAFADLGLLFNVGGPLRIERWAAYRAATLSSELMVLTFAANKSVRTLPLAGFSSAEREALLAILKQHLGPGNTKEAPIRGARLRPNVVHRR